MRQEVRWQYDSPSEEAFATVNGGSNQPILKRQYEARDRPDTKTVFIITCYLLFVICYYCLLCYAY